MRDVLLTSSALILALLALRRLFRKTLSRRVQYALWGLVLLRLLVPVSLPAAGFSLLTAAEPVVGGIEALYIAPCRDTVTAPEGAGGPYPYGEAPYAALGPASQDNIRTYSNSYDAVHETEYRRQFVLPDLLRPVWYGGMAVMALWLALSNLCFWRRLRKNRRPCPAEGCGRPVYLVEEGLASPCLFGLLWPAVYLTPAVLASPERVRHVLAHEETHARHLDPLWSLLRGVCLTIYWFDPLVWWAALASRTDCELACDEGTLRRLGDEERVPYGRTLLSLVPVRRLPANPLLSATTMTADKRRLTERVARIAGNRRSLDAALFAAVALAALACAVTFTGAKAEEAPADESLAALAEELAGPDSQLLVYTPENPPAHFSLDDGESLRVYWQLSYSLSSSLSDPMGWLCSLYRLEDGESPDPGPEAVQEVVVREGGRVYVLVYAARPPEIAAAGSSGAALMERTLDRIREALRRDGEPDGQRLREIPGGPSPLTEDALAAEGLLSRFREDPAALLNQLGRAGDRDLTLLASALADRSVLQSPWYENAEYAVLPAAAGNGTLNEDGYSAWTRLNRLIEDAMSLTAAEQVRAALDAVMSEGRAALTLTAPARGGRYEASPEDGPGDYFTSGYSWRWAGIGASVRVRSPVSLLVESGDVRLRFYSGSTLVQLEQDGETTWFSAVSNEPLDEAFRMDIFDYVRLWYDRAEWDGLLGDGVIPDRGQSRLEIAREWVDRRVSAAVKATSGSMYAHSYGRAVVELEEHVPETAFPERTEGLERFCFSYEEIFVPENDKPTSQPYAGNASEYDGRHGYAPEGALVRWLAGYMYRDGDGWRCDEIGTGF